MERIFLQLENDDDDILKIKSYLKSPLGLSKRIISLMFNDDFDNLNTKLDIIKDFVAGILRVEELADNYTLAKFYKYLFSFHQFFNSSFRARQDKVKC